MPVDLIVRYLPDDICLPAAVFEQFPGLREFDIPVCPDRTDEEPIAPVTPVPTPVAPSPLPTIEVPEELVPSVPTDSSVPMELVTPVPVPEEPVPLPDDWQFEGLDNIIQFAQP